MLLYFASVFIYSIASFTSSHTVSPGVVYIALDSIIYNASSRTHICCTSRNVVAAWSVTGTEHNRTEPSYFSKISFTLRISWESRPKLRRWAQIIPYECTFTLLLAS